MNATLCRDRSHSPRVNRPCPDCESGTKVTPQHAALSRALEARDRGATITSLPVPVAGSEWSIFVAALRSSVRDDGSVHVNDVRPKIRGRIEPKHIGMLWRRATSERLIHHEDWEQSTDHLGANADKQSRVYRWLAADLDQTERAS